MKRLPTIATSALGLGAFLFWLVAHPEWISYQEQYQLFLFNADYMAERLSVAGGVADYAAEFITQFFYVVPLGALLMALICVALQRLCLLVCRRALPGAEPRPALSMVPALLLVAHMGDEEVLPSFAVALIMTLGAALLTMRVGRWRTAAEVGMVPMLYWAAGPVALAYVLLMAVHDALRPDLSLRARTLGGIALAAYAVAAIAVIAQTALRQYPWPDAWGGINYHRNRLTYPALQFVIEAAVGLMPALAVGLHRIRLRHIGAVEMSVAIAGGAALIASSYDRDKYLQLRYDYLIRFERWNDIVRSAEKYMPATPLASSSVNLALGMTHQLGRRMFEFSQCGSDGLLCRFERNMVSCVPTAEACFRLGMVNEAMRLYFDSQESILNNRKSGRMTQRIAEANIICGRLGVARKYLADLKETIFYSRWARMAERCIDAGDLTPWDHIRSLRYTTPLIDDVDPKKMLAVLWMGNKDNRMAYDYLMAGIMLDCDMQMFANMMPTLADTDFDSLPRHYREAVAMFWLQGMLPADSRIAPSDEMKRDIRAFDTHFLMASDRRKMLKSRWNKTYWTYCLVTFPALAASTGATTLKH